jgi:hypothetical protein
MQVHRRHALGVGEDPLAFDAICKDETGDAWASLSPEVRRVKAA